METDPKHHKPDPWPSVTDHIDREEALEAYSIRGNRPVGPRRPRKGARARMAFTVAARACLAAGRRRQR